MPQSLSLLSKIEESVCKKIGGRNDLNGKRAKALLAVNDGSTHAEAGRQSGLTFGQVKYILFRFREKQLSVFPDDLVNEKENLIISKVSGSVKTINEKETNKPGKGEKKMGKKKNKKKDKKKNKLKKSKKSKKKGKKGKK